MNMAIQEKPFHVAIIGSGIGGLALAIGLLRQNVPYTIYESAPQYSVVGAGVGLGPNALRAMDMLEPKFKALYDEISTGNVTPGKDHVIFDTLLAKPGFGLDEGWGDHIGAPIYDRTSAHRKDLLDIMTSLIPIETVKFNKKATSVKQIGGKVQVTFEDGEVVVSDAVVGADGGNRGVTRPAVLGERYPDEVLPTYSGKYVYRSIVPTEQAEAILGKGMAGDSKIFLGPVRHFLSYPISHGKEANVIAFVFENKEWNEKQWTKEVSREEMIADFKGYVDDRLIKLLDWAKPIQWSLHHHLKTSTYFNGNICIIGDAAHSSLPHQAANAGQALEDSLILSHVLGLVQSPEDLSKAFQVFDSIRRPRAQKVVETSAECGIVYVLGDPEAGADRQKVVGNLNQRWLWIWEHDLSADLRKAGEEFAKLIASSKQ
ncbi:uncharacterized protein PV09_02512 [Verruconis gallopava]|uniref:FAD-binding domain-containing protein n=1 Tax=Verruconis gallopava TaxID=253628 RepID=A0A0D1Z1M3_9PEZI|nr:uncharacterized protein PV09_02512 [Verruconis gallopava]KIW06832.1 hypothetical protein PV09_02512 [Verruconis gallopava]